MKDRPPGQHSSHGHRSGLGVVDDAGGPAFVLDAPPGCPGGDLSHADRALNGDVASGHDGGQGGDQGSVVGVGVVHDDHQNGVGVLAGSQLNELTDVLGESGGQIDAHGDAQLAACGGSYD